ncbi:MAG: accessory gene regulator B family protein [Defluviitaleaceae bacterium]|nr:accessory gene regulator B family protein [Defluviitaleaceae bacterium]MCL2275145.1 accessory gene regulator B family protein [Defluviitaleaceae bacterium]
METSVLHRLAVSWTIALNRYANRDGLELKKMILGMEMLLHNVPKLILMVVTAYIVGILPLTLATWLSFAVIRRYASGLHANNSIVCSVMTIIMFVFLPLALQNVIISHVTLVVAFATFGVSLCLYAPADTLARPIVNKMRRIILKRKSIIACFSLFITTLIFHMDKLSVAILIGVACAISLTLPISYKALKRSMNNYEKYE